MKLVGLNLTSNKSTVAHTSWVYGKNLQVSKDKQSIHTEYGWIKIDDKLGIQNILSAVHCGKTKYNNITNEIIVGLALADNVDNITKQTVPYNNLIMFIYVDYGNKTFVNQYIIFSVLGSVNGVKEYPLPSLHKNIQMLYKYNALDELIVIWNNGNASDSDSIRIINVMKRIQENITPLNVKAHYLSHSNIETVNGFLNKSEANAKLNLFALFNQPDIFINSYPESGYGRGMLEEGTYNIGIQYKIADNDYTPICVYSHNIVISGSKWMDDGALNKYIGASLTVRLVNLDLRYQYYKLIVVKQTNVQTAYEYGEFETTNNNILVDSLSNKNLIGDFNYIYSKNEKAETIKLFDSKLLKGNVSTQYQYNYQKFANNIKTHFTLKEFYVDSSIKDEYRTRLTLYMTLIPDEVYAFYIYLKFIDGSLSPAFHIPGREAVAGDKTLLGATGIPDIDWLGTEYNALYYQVLDTCYLSGGILYGSFWENKNEYYPNTEDFLVYNTDANGNAVLVGDFKNQNVRHHKVPRIGEAMLKLSSGTSVELGKREPKRIGVTFYDICIPNDLINIVDSIGFAYARKSQDNITNIGMSPGFNIYLANSMGWDSSYEPLVKINNLITNQMFVYPFELLENNNKPNVKVNYIKKVYKGATKPHLANPYMIDCWGDNLVTNVQMALEYSITDFFKVEKQKYLLEDNSADLRLINTTTTTGTMIDTYKQIGLNVGLLLVNQSDYSLIGSFVYDYDFTPGGNAIPPDIYSLHQLKNNVYVNFQNQSLVLMQSPIQLDKIALKANDYTMAISSSIYNVDGYINIMSEGYDTYITSSGIDYPYRSEGLCLRTLDTAIPSYYQFDYFTYSIYPYYARAFKVGTTKYSMFGKTTGSGTSAHCAYLPDEIKLAKNNIIKPIPYDPYKRYNYSFANMIEKSLTQSDENIELNYRKFKPTEYIILEQNKAIISKLEALGNKLFVITRNTTYIGTIENFSSLQELSQLLQSGVINTTVQAQVGMSDAIKPPVEILPSEYGVIGSNQQVAIMSTSLGVFIFDENTKSLYLLGESFQKLTDYRVEDYIKTVFNSLHIDNYNNPSIEFGYLLHYDEDYNRILLLALGQRKWNFNPGVEDTYKLYYNFNNVLNGGNLTGLPLTITVVSSGTQTITINGVNYNVIKNVPTTITILANSSSLIIAGAKFSITGTITYGYGNYCFSYDLVLKIWISLHDYYFHVPLVYKDNYYSFINDDENSMYIHNYKNNIAKYINEELYPTLIDFIAQGDKERYILESVNWDSRAENLTDERVVQALLTWDKCMVYNNTQCSDYIITLPDNVDWDERYKAKLVDGTWILNNFKDVVLDNTLAILDSNYEPIVLNVNKNAIDWFSQSDFIDKFFIVRLLHNNNVFGIEQKKLYISDIGFQLRQSTR